MTEGLESEGAPGPGGPDDADQERIVALLSERGVSKPREILAMLGHYSANAMFGAIKWYDDLPQNKQNPGLLVHRIREGGMVGYKRPHEREGPGGELVIHDEHMARIRAMALSPDGMRRVDVRAVYSKLATKAQTTVDALIDSAVDALWQETPPHPACLAGFDTPDNEPPRMRYTFWVHETSERGNDNPMVDRPKPQVKRKEGESLWDWACRFWTWHDPPRLRRMIEDWRTSIEVRKADAVLAQEVSIPETPAGQNETPENADELPPEELDWEEEPA